MSRDFLIPGEVLIKVKGGNHTSLFLSGNISVLTELGLASDSIRVTPRFIHQDLNADDFGSEIPVEVKTMLADATVQINFIHYDNLILDACMAESMGGLMRGTFVNEDFAGTLTPAGSLLGNNLEPYSSGCHYISLNMICPQSDFDWHFPTCYMVAPPLEIPLGAEASMVETTWRAVPYTPINDDVGIEAVSSGRVLWDHVIDEA